MANCQPCAAVNGRSGYNAPFLVVPGSVHDPANSRSKPHLQQSQLQYPHGVFVLPRRSVRVKVRAHDMRKPHWSDDMPGICTAQPLHGVLTPLPPVSHRSGTATTCQQQGSDVSCQDILLQGPPYGAVTGVLQGNQTAQHRASRGCWVCFRQVRVH
jgi:hypothetical protein